MKHNPITSKWIFAIFVVSMLSITQAVLAFDVQPQSDYSTSTGSLRIDVKDSTGKAIPSASVYLDEKYINPTNDYGSIILYPASQGSHNVKVNCPSGKLCGTKTVSVIGDASASFKCDCTVPTGDLRVDVDIAEGYRSQE